MNKAILPALMTLALLIVGIGFQSSLEPRVARLEFNDLTHAANFTKWACGQGAGTCNPVFQTATARPTATTIALPSATPRPIPNTPSQEAWGKCGRVMAADGLNARPAPNQAPKLIIPTGTLIYYDNNDLLFYGGKTWVRVQYPAPYVGLWVALIHLGGCNG
jgi:hypothetical protein